MRVNVTFFEIQNGEWVSVAILANVSLGTAESIIDDWMDANDHKAEVRDLDGNLLDF